MARNYSTEIILQPYFQYLLGVDFFLNWERSGGNLFKIGNKKYYELLLYYTVLVDSTTCLLRITSSTLRPSTKQSRRPSSHHTHVE